MTHDEKVINTFNQNFESVTDENLKLIFSKCTLSRKLTFYKLSYDKKGPQIKDLFKSFDELLKKSLGTKDPAEYSRIGNLFFQIWLKSIDIDLGVDLYKYNTTKTGRKSGR